MRFTVRSQVLLYSQTHLLGDSYGRYASSPASLPWQHGCPAPPSPPPAGGRPGSPPPPSPPAGPGPTTPSPAPAGGGPGSASPSSTAAGTGSTTPASSSTGTDGAPSHASTAGTDTFLGGPGPWRGADATNPTGPSRARVHPRWHGLHASGSGAGARATSTNRHGGCGPDRLRYHDL